MSSNLAIPFNIDLLIPNEALVRNLRKVSSPDTFVGATKNFHPDGLYSNETFGIVGTDARSKRFAYIDLKVTIIHPVIYANLIGNKAFYKEILEGKTFASWDPVAKDFVKSDVVDGFTGYEFFISHLEELTIVKNGSVSRDQAAALLEKYKHNCTFSKVVVLPAGLRDIEIDENGRASSDEINDFYYKLLSYSATISEAIARSNIEVYNKHRVQIQNCFNDIYDLLKSVIEGKKNLMMGKWASRKVFNGTRNVITAMSTIQQVLGTSENITADNTLIGIYQTAKGLLPLTVTNLKSGFLSTVFTTMGTPALLTNPHTLQSERVKLQPLTYNNWLDNEGLEKFITSFKEDSIRHLPIMVEDHYLGLCYLGPDGTYALINGVEQLPENRRPEECIPITPAILLYCVLYPFAGRFPVFITRYPITGIGSIYPSFPYLKSTVRSEKRAELDVNTWVRTGNVALEFPIMSSSFYNSLSPHSAQLAGLGADFDGDTCSANFVYSDEAVKEVNDFLSKKRSHVGTDGRLIADLNTKTIQYVLAYTTG